MGKSESNILSDMDFVIPLNILTVTNLAKRKGDSTAVSRCISRSL